MLYCGPLMRSAVSTLGTSGIVAPNILALFDATRSLRTQGVQCIPTVDSTLLWTLPLLSGLQKRIQGELVAKRRTAAMASLPTGLKVRASSFQSHGYSGPLVQTSHSTECCVPWRPQQAWSDGSSCWFQGAYARQGLLYVWNGPTLVVALSLTKSRVSRNSPLGLRTGCTWLQWVALDDLKIGVRIACCFSAE